MSEARKNLFVRILTLEEVIFEGECLSVNFKAGEGEITLQISQGEFLSELKPGPIVVIKERERIRLNNLTSGIAYLKDDKLSLTSLRIESQEG